MLRCVSKGGRAYGFDVDNAYIEDLDSGRALYITAAVHADPNQVVNDDGYDYPTTGAFLQALGASLAKATFNDDPKR